MKIETGADLYAAREKLGWTAAQLGKALRLSGDSSKRGSKINELERGGKPIGGPTAVAVEAFVLGFRPSGWNPATDG